MSRFLLLVVLVLALLSLTAAVTPAIYTSDEEESAVSAPSACPNSCSSHGTCSTAGSVSTCVCDAGYLAADCSIASVMKPMCWLTSAVCSYWQIKDDVLYQRVTSTEGRGWVGVIWGSTDGMSNGQSTIMTIPTQYLPTLFEGYNTKKGKPTNTSAQSIPQSNVTGFLTSTGGLDVSFHRRLNTGLTDHFVIPAKAGTQTSMSIAYGEVVFEFHGKNATNFKIDIAAAAAGTLVEEGVLARVLRLLKGGK